MPIAYWPASGPVKAARYGMFTGMVEFKSREDLVQALGLTNLWGFVSSPRASRFERIKLIVSGWMDMCPLRIL